MQIRKIPIEYWFGLVWVNKFVKINSPWVEDSNDTSNLYVRTPIKQFISCQNHQPYLGLKSWTFGPQKITLKLIYGHFPLGGAENAPPVSNRVNQFLCNTNQKIADWTLIRFGLDKFLCLNKEPLSERFQWHLTLVCMTPTKWFISCQT